MSLYATVKKPGPGYMYNVDVHEHDGRRLIAYGTVCYTLRGARREAKRLLKRAERDRTAKGYREEVRL